MTDAHKDFDVSRFTIYDWQRKVKLAAEGKGDSPTSGPDPQDIEAQRDKEILDEWHRHPGLGPSQIKNQLRRKGVKVSVHTTRRVMEEAGYRPPKVKRLDVSEANLRRRSFLRAVAVSAAAISVGRPIGGCHGVEASDLPESFKVLTHTNKKRVAFKGSGSSSLMTLQDSRDCVVARISVYLRIRSTDARSAKVYLTSPSGTRVHLVHGATYPPTRRSPKARRMVRPKGPPYRGVPDRVRW